MKRSRNVRSRGLVLVGVVLAASVAGVFLLVPSASGAVKPAKGDWLALIRPVDGPLTTTRMVLRVSGGKKQKVNVGSMTVIGCTTIQSIEVNASAKVKKGKFKIAKSTTGEDGESIDFKINGKFTSKTRVSGKIDVMFGDIPGQPGSGCGERKFEFQGGL